MPDHPNRRREDNAWYQHKLIAVIIALILGAYGSYGFTALVYKWVKDEQAAMTAAFRQDLQEIINVARETNRKIDCLSDKRFCR